MATPTKTVSTSSLMQEGRTFPPSQDVIRRAYINHEQYQQMYDRSIRPTRTGSGSNRPPRSTGSRNHQGPQIRLGHRRKKSRAHLVRGWPAQRDASTAWTAI